MAIRTQPPSDGGKNAFRNGKVIYHVPGGSRFTERESYVPRTGGFAFHGTGFFLSRNGEFFFIERGGSRPRSVNYRSNYNYRPNYRENCLRSFPRNGGRDSFRTERVTPSASRPSTLVRKRSSIGPARNKEGCRPVRDNAPLRHDPRPKTVVKNRHRTSRDQLALPARWSDPSVDRCWRTHWPDLRLWKQLPRAPQLGAVGIAVSVVVNSPDGLIAKSTA